MSGKKPLVTYPSYPSGPSAVDPLMGAGRSFPAPAPTGTTSIITAVFAILGAVAALPMGMAQLVGMRTEGFLVEWSPYVLIIHVVQAVLLLLGGIQLLLRQRVGQWFIGLGCGLAIGVNVGTLVMSLVKGDFTDAHTAATAGTFLVLAVIPLPPALVTLVLVLLPSTSRWVRFQPAGPRTPCPPPSPSEQWCAAGQAPAAVSAPVAGEVRLTVTSVLSDYFEGLRLHPGLRYVRWTQWALGCVVLAHLLLSIMSRDWSLITPSPILAVGVLAFPRVTFHLMARSLVNNQRVALDGIVTVSERGLEMVNGDNHSGYTWSRYQGFVESRRSFILYTPGRAAIGLYVLPKRAFLEPSDVDRVRIILSRHLPARSVGVRPAAA